MSDETTTLGRLRGIVNDFVAQRAWERYHDAKNLSMSIAIEAAELMERFQWIRNDELPALLADADHQAAVRDEVADIACYLLALVNVLRIDLSTAAQDKRAKNTAKDPGA